MCFRLIWQRGYNLRPVLVGPYDTVKIEDRSRKRSHKFDGNGVGRIRTFPFLPIPFTTPSLMIQWKLGCRSRKQKRKNQPIAKPGVEHCRWFIFPLLLATAIMQFSLDRKALVNEDTLLRTHCCPWCFLGCANWKTFVADKMFLNKIRNIFCVPDTKFVSATNVARAGKQRNICVGNDVSSFAWALSDGVISRISVLLPTLSVWLSLDRSALHFWLWLRRMLPLNGS